MLMSFRSYVMNHHPISLIAVSSLVILYHFFENSYDFLLIVCLLYMHHRGWGSDGLLVGKALI